MDLVRMGYIKIIRGHDPITVSCSIMLIDGLYVRCLENTRKSETRKSNMYANTLVTSAIATVIRIISNTFLVCPTYSLSPR